MRLRDVRLSGLVAAFGLCALFVAQFNIASGVIQRGLNAGGMGLTFILLAIYMEARKIAVAQEKASKPH